MAKPITTPADLRDSIPALSDVTYLNFGASGPSPRPVVDAAESILEYHEFDAPGGEGMYTAAFDTYDDVRETVARFVGASPDEIALTQSTTDAINRFGCALEWEPGDIVVRTDLEHPAGILPWQRLEHGRGVEVRVVETERGRIDLDAYRDAVAGAKLVVFSALSWNYGTRLPVRELTEIAHEAGALVLVDAVQWPGQAPIDFAEWGADAVAAAGHKWLLGTWGGGFLYVEASVADGLVPGALGYRGVVEATADPYELAPGATRFEIGTINPAPHVALQAAIEITARIGIETIEDRIRRLAERLADEVPADRLLSPPAPESGLVTIAVDDPEAVTERIRADGIVVRPLPEPDAIRASVHAVNTEDEVDALLDALEGVQ
ncbi:aminotransferase class V-fold PLP-dependent enzyme [Halovivax gelatinilyticus]|uniref:aminotransferase class V-fold PLP-dependent enzyme n=1 Tax=Halovivax gelatinilyticus TaxID=2961597 RepID=UPI0020CA3112|nr:aminotransferase class V-fold PLP-dependent enzyme [Halovivax gelatinilyticus]